MINLESFIKAPKNKKDLPLLLRKYYNLVIRFKDFHNSVISAIFPNKIKPSGFIEFDEVRKRARVRSDISDHLETIFIEALSVNPKLIVELGVGPGQSTFILERVARLCGAKMVSVDIREEVSSATDWKDWIFVNDDDIEFSNRFHQWMDKNNCGPNIDVLFIDTSHKYEHTVREIESWFKFLKPGSVVMFHDSNSGLIYRYRDGGIGIGYSIKRGVIKAIEEYLQTKYDEKENFIDVRNGWVVKHLALCNGLTILRRVK